MLENCQRNHMILGLGALTLITILVLIVESRYAADGGSTARRRSAQQFVIEDNSTCWRHEAYSVIRECQPCTQFDIVSGVCMHTHYREVLRCKSGETVYKSCDRVAYIEQRNFIKFEVCAFALGVLSYLISYTRDRVLSRRNYLRIERQLNRMN
ncbi:hypothetical protein KR222_008855 [Zaprionus bogoriensis]|nr:hypothetical protein KR222_008855 [Zaprionus bogoriensis]